MFVRSSIGPGPVGFHARVLRVHSLEAGISKAVKCESQPKCSSVLSRSSDTTGTVTLLVRGIPDKKTYLDRLVELRLGPFVVVVADPALCFDWDGGLSRRFVRNAVKPRSRAPFGPDAPNPPECSRTA